VSPATEVRMREMDALDQIAARIRFVKGPFKTNRSMRREMRHRERLVAANDRLKDTK